MPVRHWAARPPFLPLSAVTTPRPEVPLRPFPSVTGTTSASLALTSLSAAFCLALLASPSAWAGAPKVHTVALGGVKKVPFTPAEATADTKSEETSTLRVRPLVVDGRQKEWTIGETHDVTDRSFVVRRALRINDSLPNDANPRWVWQPGPWILVDRVTGHITALHLPAFDTSVSNVVWFRDYAAYCGVATTAKGGLVGVVAQLGARKAIAQKGIGKWPQPERTTSACQPAQWQRLPMRVTLKPVDGESFTLDVLGSTSLSKRAITTTVRPRAA